MYTITKSVIRNEQYALAINKMNVSGKRWYCLILVKNINFITFNQLANNYNF